MERPIKELLQIMVDNIELFKQRECHGLCDLSLILSLNSKIAASEMITIQGYITLNMPNRCNGWHQMSSYGWPPCELQPRLEWLNEQINKL